jgi:hypothetical protein
VLAFIIGPGTVIIYQIAGVFFFTTLVLVNIMPKYLIHFAQVHEEFRIPELESIAELHGFKLGWSNDENDKDPTRPYMVLELDREENVRLLARRCILVK